MIILAHFKILPASFFVGVVLITLVSSCGTASFKEYQYTHKLQTGATLTLLNPLTIQKRTASVIIQDGKITTYTRADLYHPYCTVNLNKLAKFQTSLKPDTFTVSKFYNYTRSTSRDEIEYESLMNLASSANPTVTYMSCKYQGDLADGDLTISAIEQTLRGIFKLKRINSQHNDAGNTRDGEHNPIDNKIGEPYKTGTGN